MFSKHKLPGEGLLSAINVIIVTQNHETIARQQDKGSRDWRDDQPFLAKIFLRASDDPITCEAI
jgi:hypothetical protein